VALKFRLIDKRRILVIACTELLPNSLLLLGDVLPELAGLLPERLHPRRADRANQRRRGLDWIGLDWGK
jgi:hypothetical protein